MKNKIGLAGLTVAAALVVASQTGVAQSAVNYFDVTSTSTGTGTATCSGGSKVVGGGYKTIPTNNYSSTSSNEYAVTGSYAASATSWRVTGTKTHGSYTPNGGWKFSDSSWSPTAVAVCTK